MNRALTLMPDLFSLLLIPVIWLGGCDGNVDSKLPQNTSDLPLLKRNHESETPQYVNNDGIWVSFKGVSFFVEREIAAEVVKEEVGPVFPEDLAFRPDGIEPRHILFRFTRGSSTSDLQTSFYPEIKVYAVKDYLDTFAGMEDYADTLKIKFEKLKTVISEKKNLKEREYPFIPFLDATQVLHARTEYLDFKNGSGIAYITQFSHSDPILVNNSDIVFIFQGLTADEQYFISAIIPISISFLPDKPYGASHNGYSIPDNFYQSNRRKKNEIAYEHYLDYVERELHAANKNQFSPSLISLKSLIKSIEIDTNSIE